MELKIAKFNEVTVEDMYEIIRSRFEVFIKEQKIIDEPELDGIDKKCYHVYYKENDKVVAYCRIVPKGLVYDYVAIGRVLVLEDYRRRGLAQSLLKEALKYILKEINEKTVVLSSQLYAKPLYESVGFKVVSDIYDEAGIPHVKMKLQMVD